MHSIFSGEWERKRRRRRISVFSSLAILIFIVLLFSMNSGITPLGPLEVLKTLFGFGDSNQNLVLFQFRLPRIVIALLVGAALAVSGCVLQGISRNSLADPGILGITTGAGLFVVLYISFFSSIDAASPYLLPVFALFGGLLAAALIYILAYDRQLGLVPMRMILTGIAVAAGLNALMTVLMLRLQPEQFDFVAIWLAGRIYGSTWPYVYSFLPWFIILSIFIYYRWRALDTLTFGEQMAKGLGLRVEKERLLLTFASVALAASAVSVSGGIGFVGLIAPHIARRLIGPNHALVLPASALLGGLLLLFADTLGRTIIQPSEIHAGIVVAVIGAPYFLYLLARSNV
ncbi:iron complex transport system permease protein [Marinococcus luteus]|uniref:Iron complex transport system permease protein n=1 Tax=Marinococcus luteus TaxID=1122204 RepID=A0A1H2WX18_9BACI|nr:iron ABC transporter permease [Marinococcus luteus]SDW85121.1 iron complex transport system permease protein [Marinococcus luteus]